MQTKPINRRDALLLGGTATVGGVAAALAGPAQAAPRIRVAALADVGPGEPVWFDYPEGASAMLVDLGTAVEGGVGPNGSIVAYSALCQHMGCPVDYRHETKDFFCPCHASKFDALKGGQAIDGPAPRGLPRITLAVEGDEVFAEGIDGLVYGFACHA